MVIGLTGAIGSGKSYICDVFSCRCGITVVDSDSVIKNTLMYYIPVATQVMKTFGDDSYINGKLNRDKLNKILYDNSKNLEKINNILVPYLMEYVKNISQMNKNILLECPILFNTNMYKVVDKKILVKCDVDTRFRRLRERYDDDSELIMNKINSQSFDESKADYILINNKKIELQVQKLIKIFNI
jgi:dephospho-CoA kinase